MHTFVPLSRKLTCTDFAGASAAAGLLAATLQYGTVC
jgi:hypothetical protein